MLESTEKGGVRNSIRNCLTVFQNDPLLSGAIAKNLLTERTDIIKPIGYHRTGTAITDTDMNYLLLYLEETYGLTSEKKIAAAIGIVANENGYHPIRDYLNGLTWDGTERIRTCLHHFLGADSDQYTYEALRLFLLGAIHRAFHPGCKFEVMLCLVGGQGAGKSTFFRLLAVKDEWFSDDLRKLDDDNVYRKLQGHWIIEMSEMIATANAKSIEETIILYQAENYIYCLMESVSGLSDLLSNCLKHIRELHNQSVKVGISNPFQDISYTQHASTQAKRRLSAGYRIDGVYVFTHTYSSRAVRSLISIQDLDNLQRALLSGNGQNADRILETIHQTISHSEQNSVELRQMFFSLRSVYATVCNQFSLEAERNGETRYHAPILPNDLDEYDLDSVYEVFRSLNIELQQQYEIVMARTARSLGTDILAYIDQNYTDPNLCAGVIADVFHISEKYIFQLLKSCCNETLNDRILRLRIDEGIRLLTTTDLTITTIAKKTGFSSSNTMYKAFMRVKGISPSSYRGKEI